MIKSSFFYNNRSTLSPYETLALEEAMMDRLLPGEIILYLYTHDRAVIIGKNQNAWKECRFEKLEAEGGKMARRISGGGAVFHDMGNLNFSFIMKEEDYDLGRQLGVILRAVRALGVDAEFTGRNDITAGGKKFSGNAFCFRKGAAFHHGTIMIDVCKDDLTRYLSVSKDKIVSKGIDSVVSRVCNLKELSPAVTPESMATELRRAFDEEYGVSSDYIVTDEIAAAERAIAERNASWDWKFGYMGDFDITMDRRFPWGSFELHLKLEDARVADAAVYSDAMDTDYIASLPSIIKGKAFSCGDMETALLSAVSSPGQKAMAEDITAFIKERTV